MFETLGKLSILSNSICSIYDSQLYWKPASLQMLLLSVKRLFTSMVFEFRKISDTSAVEFRFTETLHLLLKLYLPLVHKIGFASKFKLNHKIKSNIYNISLYIKHPQSIFPIYLILFLNSNNESLDFTTSRNYSIWQNHENELHLYYSEMVSQG